MKRCILLLAVLSLLCTSCYTARIVTVSPHNYDYGTYSTTVTVPRTHTVSTTTRVTAMDRDISLYLDLQAVGAAFAQSSTVEEFENILNDGSYMLSNLDLNNDGYVDYLRVLETVEGRNHVFLIQAVLAENVYQDVATVVAELQGASNAYVQIIGSSYIYGPEFIIRPVYITTPLIFAHLIRPDYRPWISPWHWNHFPPHYKRPAPVYVGHYIAYIDTYMSNHRYCREFRYEPVCHFPDYDRVSRGSQRNDYGRQHPERSFQQRNTMSHSQNVNPIRNARDIREAQPAPIRQDRQASANRQPGTSRQPQQPSTGRQPAQQRQPSTGRQPVQQRQPSTGKPAQQSRPNQSADKTTVNSRVRQSGSTNTSISTVSPNGDKSTVKRGSGSNRNTSGSTTVQHGPGAGSRTRR